MDQKVPGVGNDNPNANCTSKFASAPAAESVWLFTPPVARQIKSGVSIHDACASGAGRGDKRRRTVDELDLERRVDRRRHLVLVERLQVHHVRVLLEVACDADLVVLRRGLVPDRVVQLLEARNRDRRVAARIDLDAGPRHRDGARLGGRGERLVLGEVEGRALALGAAEHRRGLHELDVPVQMLGQAVARRAHNRVVLVHGVLPDMVFLQTHTIKRKYTALGEEQERHSRCRAFSPPERRAREQ